MDNKIIEEFNNMSSKLVKSYSTLKQIEQVDIATTPKTGVYNEDKLLVHQ